MAELVAAVGVPHTPMFPAWVQQGGVHQETAALYEAVRRALETTDPDVLVIFDSDHLNTFFFDNYPTFCIGVAPATAGPNEPLPGVPFTPIPMREDVARHLYRSAVERDFDLSVSQEFQVDHSIMVPLHFLTPKMERPIVPLFINGIVPPLPSAQRCFRLGKALRQALGQWPADLKVALLASGSFALEVGGPKMGWTDEAWLDTVLHCLDHGAPEELLRQATTERMLKAGNVSGELLNWIALWGAIDGRRPDFLEPQRQYGHAYAVWRWDR